MRDRLDGKENKGMQTKILDWMKSQLVLVLIVVLGVLMNGMPVYGTEDGLTEEEVKKKVVEIIEEEKKGEISKYTIMEYDIEKMYPIISLGLFVNDYIQGKSFLEIVREAEKKSEKQGTQWMLPYKNYQGAKCYAIFISLNNEVEMLTRTIEVENDCDMKLYNGKYTGIDMLEVKKVIYQNLDLYMFRITYVCMNDGKEYIIPFLNQKIAKECDLKNEKIYRLDDFVTILYNSYKEMKDEYSVEGMATAKIFVKNRNKTLKYDSITQIRLMEVLKKNSVILVVVGIVSVSGVYLCVSKIKRKGKKHLN